MVVTVAPVFGHSANLLQCGEHAPVQYLGAEGTVETLDVGVLDWLVGLDVDEIDTVILGPLLQGLTDEFRIRAGSRRLPHRGRLSFSAVKTRHARVEQPGWAGFNGDAASEDLIEYRHIALKPGLAGRSTGPAR